MGHSIIAPNGEPRGRLPDAQRTALADVDSAPDGPGNSHGHSVSRRGHYYAHSGAIGDARHHARTAALGGA